MGGDPDVWGGTHASGSRELGGHIYLRPGETVVKIIFHLVILGQAEQVAVLHVHQVLGLSVGRVRALVTHNSPGGGMDRTRAGGTGRPETGLGAA